MSPSAICCCGATLNPVMVGERYLDVVCSGCINPPPRCSCVRPSESIVTTFMLSPGDPLHRYDPWGP